MKKLTYILLFISCSVMGQGAIFENFKVFSISTDTVPAVTDSLLAFYPLSRNNTNDYSGNDNHLTNNNASSDTFGNGSYFFNGVDAYLSADGTDLQAGLRDMSVSVWVYPSGAGTIAGVTGSSGQANAGYSVANGATEWLGIMASDAIQRTTSGTNLSTQWYNLVVTFDRDGNMTGYLDGAQDGVISITNFSATDIDYSRDFLIGARNSASPNFFYTGYVKFVYVFNKVLTATERTLLYKQGQNL